MHSLIVLQRLGPRHRPRPITGARPLKWTWLCVLAASTACTPGGDTATPGPDPALRDTLMGLIESAYDFRQNDVVQRMTALYPDTGRVISASDGYLIDSGDSVRQGITRFWENVGRNMQDPRWEWGDVHVDRLGPDAAVLTATWSIPHVAPTQRPHTIRGAWTAVFVRRARAWKIVQEHLSIPPAP